LLPNQVTQKASRFVFWCPLCEARRYSLFAATQPQPQLHMPFNAAAHANTKWHVQLGVIAQSTPKSQKQTKSNAHHMPTHVTTRLSTQDLKKKHAH
jgi:hypothetical protein